MAKAGKVPPRKKKKESLEDRQQVLQEARELLKCWMQTRNFLLLAFVDDPVSEQQERDFFELRTRANRLRRILDEKLADVELDFASDKINDFLHKCINISHMRGLPLADRRELVATWHVASVMLHRLVGALEFMIETRQKAKRKKRGVGGIKAIKAEAAAVGKKSKVPVVVGVAVVLAVAAGLYYFLFVGV